MPTPADHVLVVAISSRALFDFEEENTAFDAGDEAGYMKLQLDRLETPARKGVGFNLCKKLLALNFPDPKNDQRTEVVVLSRNDPISGLRVFKSAEHHNLPVTRGAFVRGENPYPYLHSFRASLFLSANPEDVKQALEMGIPAASVFPRPSGEDSSHNELRIAFDGDSVLFSDEAEKVYDERQLEGFMEHEVSKANEPLPDGPFKPFLQALHRLQATLPADSPIKIKTALVTARGAPSHERAMRTLMRWGVEVDNAFFLDGWDKTSFLETFHPDFFFDDQLGHIDKAKSKVHSGHVPFGIKNLPKPNQKQNQVT